MNTSLKFAVLSIIFLGTSAFIFSQTTINPFEIRNLESNNKKEMNDSSVASISFVNPFELKSSIFVDTSKTQIKIIKNYSLFPHFTLGKIQFQTVQKTLFWVLLFLSFLLALALNLNRTITQNIFRSFTNINFFSLQVREVKDPQKFIFFILYGMFLIGLSIFFYVSYIYFRKLIHPNYLFAIAVCLCLIYFIRHMSLFIIGYIFRIEKEMYVLSYSIISYGSLLGIFLIPVDFAITFVNPAVAKNVIIAMCLIMILLYVIRTLRDIFVCANLWTRSIFHFLLYLCTFEIAPFLVLFKLLKVEGIFG